MRVRARAQAGARCYRNDGMLARAYSRAYGAIEGTKCAPYARIYVVVTPLGRRRVGIASSAAFINQNMARDITIREHTIHTPLRSTCDRGRDRERDRIIFIYICIYMYILYIICYICIYVYMLFSRVQHIYGIYMVAGIYGIYKWRHADRQERTAE